MIVLLASTFHLQVSLQLPATDDNTEYQRRYHSYLLSSGFGVEGVGVALPAFLPKLNLIFKLGFLWLPSTTGDSAAVRATVACSRFDLGVDIAAVLEGSGVLPVPLGKGTLIFVLEVFDVAECDPGVPSLGRGLAPPHDGDSLAL